MAAIVARWLTSAGMVAKREFVIPWGICDLVGVRFDEEKVAHRLSLKQTRALSSITRVLLLQEIPDVETQKSTTLDRLVRRYAPSVPREIVRAETQRLIDERFVVRGPCGVLQRKNGWMPLQDKLVAVELKLTRIENAMHQALNNLGFADESYVAFPADVARRIASNPARWDRFLSAGVGLLSVARRSCEISIAAKHGRRRTDGALQMYCVEKFWRTRSRGN